MTSIKKPFQTICLHIKKKILSLYVENGELFFGEQGFHISLLKMKKLNSITTNFLVKSKPRKKKTM